MGCATFLIVAAYSKSGMFALAMVTVSAAFQGLMTFGSAINHVDLSPRFAGILYAYTNFFSSIAGIIGPYIADVLTVSLPLHCVCLSVCLCVFACVCVRVCGKEGEGEREKDRDRTSIDAWPNPDNCKINTVDTTVTESPCAGEPTGVQVDHNNEDYDQTP